MTEENNLSRLLVWESLLDHTNYYELLGILEIADEAAVKAAFHDFALAFHPDGHLGAAPAALDAARRVFQRGVEAYRVLRDPTLRARYDLDLAKGRTRLLQEDPAAAHPPSPIKSLDELCRTAAARLCASKADELISAGDLRGAKRELKMALYHDGNDNPELEERLDALEDALFAMGD